MITLNVVFCIYKSWSSVGKHGAPYMIEMQVREDHIGNIGSCYAVSSK